MDNIWADSFSEIREHSLQEKKQDKKEGKPKRWWDDDGDGIGYEEGEVSGKFKKTKKEGKDYDPMEDPEFDHDEAERTRGQSGKNKSIGGKKKTKKEEVELGEAKDCVPKSEKGKHNCAKKVCHEQFGEGQCIFGEHAEPDENGFVSHYDVLFSHGVEKNVPVSEMEVLEEGSHNEENHRYAGKIVDEGLKQARKNVGASTCWKGYKAKGTKKKDGKEVPNCVPEERELSSKKDNGEMIDVMKGKNKVEINPKLGEEIEAWVGQLLDEGYDLSQFTPDEIVEIYESAEGEDNTQVSAVKAAAARSRVRADRDRLRVSQMQQRTKTAPMESVLNFVEGRTLPNFEV